MPRPHDNALARRRCESRTPSLRIETPNDDCRRCLRRSVTSSSSVSFLFIPKRHQMATYSKNLKQTHAWRDEESYIKCPTASKINSHCELSGIKSTTNIWWMQLRWEATTTSSGCITLISPWHSIHTGLSSMLPSKATRLQCIRTTSRRRCCWRCNCRCRHRRRCNSSASSSGRCCSGSIIYCPTRSNVRLETLLARLMQWREYRVRFIGFTAVLREFRYGWRAKW